MHQLKKNLNRFDLIFYIVLFLGVLAPLLFTGWQMGLFRKPISVDAAPLCDRTAGCFAWLLRVTLRLIPS